MKLKIKNNLVQLFKRSRFKAFTKSQITKISLITKITKKLLCFLKVPLF